MTRRLGPRAPCLDVASALDELRQQIARAAALAQAAEDRFDDILWDGDQLDNAEQLEHLGHLISATKDAVNGAALTSKAIAAELVTAVRA